MYPYSYFPSDKSTNYAAMAFNTQDGHGGRAEEHRAEMEAIARAIINEEIDKLMDKLPQIIEEKCREAYRQAIADFLHALEYDIESIVEIGFEGCRDIYVDKKTQKYISNHILKEVQKRLNGKDFRH